MSSLDLGLIGNSTIAALIDADGAIVWACVPRFDGEPVFDALLRGEQDPDAAQGRFAVELVDCVRNEQEYVRNTAVLVTRLYASDGAAIEITDFAPRFKQFGRTFRPVMLVRQVRPLAGTPRVRVRLRPQAAHGAEPVTVTHGSNHIRYVLPDGVLRLTTDGSVTAVLDELAQVLDEPLTLLLGPDETCPDNVRTLAQRFHDETCAYWYEWVRYLGIPFEWQSAVIRAAITLKLNAYDDTGAIVAAVTSSIPEAPGSGRNWDYRHCWLRDAWFVVAALNRLGATLTMERYLAWIINRIAASSDGRLGPVYRINGTTELDEHIVETLPGYRGMGPVRMGNAAWTQVQNDVYGAAVLAAAHVFYDERLRHAGDASLFARLEILGHRAAENYATPDAGLWEYRGIAKVHTFSAVMCWAACDRLARIAAHLGLEERHRDWRRKADAMHADIAARAWNADMNTFVESFGGRDLDASLLLLCQLGFVAADDARFHATVAAVERHLKRGDFLLRYATEDDFGLPETAFTVCTFWYVDALHAIGRGDEARALFEDLLRHRNRHGLLSEDIDPRTGELWGNFPQTYSMVGLINSALRLSKPWEGEY
ncbi:MAG: glycoside hydrolase family 15 protein [Gammaproteobacteria bacterium]